MTQEERLPASEEREEPAHIDSNCPSCNAVLVLYDELPLKKFRESEDLGPPPEGDEEIWYDEWVCPECLDGIRMDWPDSTFEELEERMEDEEYIEFERGDFE